MEPFKITDDFGSELVLIGSRFSTGYGISALYLVSHEAWREKEPESLAAAVKFVLHVTTVGNIHNLFYKETKSAKKALGVLTEVAKKEND